MLGALAKAGSGEPRISPAVNAGQDDCCVCFQSVPNDEWKTPQDRPPVASIPLRVCVRVVADTPEQRIRRAPELRSLAWVLRFVPVLDSCKVELGSPTKQDPCLQLRRCSRRALTSGHGLWLPGLVSKSASRASSRARSSGVTGRSSSESVFQSASISRRRSLGFSLRASSSRFVLTVEVYARRLPGRLTGGVILPGGQVWITFRRESRPDPLLKVERLHDEHRHLSPRVGVGRAVVAAAAAAGDVLGGELFDPVGERSRARHIRKDSRWDAGGGDVARAVRRSTARAERGEAGSARAYGPLRRRLKVFVRKTAICPRVTGSEGQYMPPPQPAVMPRLKRSSIQSAY